MSLKDSKRLIKLFLFYILIIFQIESNSKAQESQESIIISKNLGVKRVGSIFNEDLELKQVPENFVPQKISTSCGCTAAKFTAAEKLSSAKLSVQWRIPEKTGPVGTRIELQGEIDSKDTKITLELQAIARGVLQFDNTHAIWLYDEQNGLVDLTLKLNNNFVKITKTDMKAIFEIDGKQSQAFIRPTAVKNKDELISQWEVIISGSAYRRSPAINSAGTLIVTGKDIDGNEYKSTSDVSIRRGSSITARVVESSENSFSLDIFIKVPLKDWDLRNIEIVDASNENVLPFDVVRQGQYFGRVHLQIPIAARPKSLLIRFKSEMFPSCKLEL